MIKKLRNQPYAPKWEQEEKRKKEEESYLTENMFQAKLRKTEAGLQQEIVLEPVLYLIYTKDLLTWNNSTATHTWRSSDSLKETPSYHQ
jgi:hypothetical protein